MNLLVAVNLAADAHEDADKLLPELGISLYNEGLFKLGCRKWAINKIPTGEIGKISLG